MNTYFPHSRINYYNSMYDFYDHLLFYGDISKEDYDDDIKKLALQEQAEREAFYKENNSESM